MLAQRGRRPELTNNLSMELDDFLGPKPTVIDLQAENRWEAIEELVNHLVVTQKIKAEHRAVISEGVRRRESSMSTGIGSGIALPHAATNLVSGVVGAIGRSRKGIQFDSLDGKPVNLVMLFLVPQGQVQEHLRTLAKLAMLLQARDFREGLRKEEGSRREPGPG